MKKLLIALSLIFTATTANAADFIHDTTDRGIELIIIDGKILKGDGDKFVNLLNKYPKTKAIVLNSIGGLVYEGMYIADTVRDRGLNTFVLNENVCFSICAPIFFSGKNKFIQEHAYLGVHAAHDIRDNSISPEVNALIAWYFGALGYDIRLVELWISAKPDKLNYITAQINEELNLGIQSID
jgi:hypothetical protein